MDWLKDYGALVAASIAAIVAFFIALVQLRRERLLGREQWLRSTRMPVYVEFLEAATEFSEAIFVRFGDWDAEIFGPFPDPEPLYGACSRRFLLALQGVQVVGPGEVAAAAIITRYSLWNYHAQLESQPFANTPVEFNDARAAFIEQAQRALGTESDAPEVPDYTTWRDELKDKDD